MVFEKAMVARVVLQYPVDQSLGETIMAWPIIKIFTLKNALVFDEINKKR